MEIGGTVGDIESPAYFEAIRQFAHDVGRRNCLFMHLTYAPYLSTAGEVKTKPTQHAVRALLELGIQADIVVVRASHPVPENELKKIAQFTNVPAGNVVSCPDSDTIYRVPLTLHENGLDTAVLKTFGMTAQEPNLSSWVKVAQTHTHPSQTVKISVVGKYVQLGDAYKSLNEALVHGGLAHEAKVEIDFVDAEVLEDKTQEEVAKYLKGTNGILVPGGFGSRGTEGKIKAVQYAREHNVPYFGICLGMQMATIEYARNVACLEGADSTEFTEDKGAPKHPVIGLMTEWQTDDGSEQRDATTDLGGTMRLGGYPCTLKEGTTSFSMYEKEKIIERHRHRYEFNNTYRDQLEKAGLVFAGTSPDGTLVEIVEVKGHPWFVAVQYHPEFKSRPMEPHPLFAGFIGASLGYQAGKGGKEESSPVEAVAA